MGFIRNIWDDLLSLGAFIVTLVIFWLPVWAAHIAVDAGLALVWVYVALAALVCVGGNLAIAFIRKALAGVAPLRYRKQ